MLVVLSIIFMSKELIIILPGFQYTKQGTLTIDKVKIEALVSNQPVSIWYLDTDTKQYLSTEYLELLKLTDSVEPISNSTIYNNGYLYANLSESLKRAPTGYFQQYLVDDNTYNISVFNRDVQYLNNNSVLHDGLGFIKLSNINSDIVFKVSFYSLFQYIEESNGDNIENYVLVDSKNYYYNPLIEGLDDSFVLEASDPIVLKYNNDLKENAKIAVKLNNNVILYNYSTASDELVQVKWNGSDYYQTYSYFKPASLQLWACPQIILNESKVDTEGTDQGAEGSNAGTVLFQIGENVVSSDCTNIPPNPILWYKDGSYDLYKLLQKQQDYYKNLENSVQLKAGQLHNYGIYYTNLSKSGQTWGLVVDSSGLYTYHFFQDSPISYNNRAYLNKQGLNSDEYLLNITKGKPEFHNNWKKRYYITTEKLKLTSKAPDKTQIHQMVYNCLSNKDNPDLSLSLVSPNTIYTFSNYSKDDFSYLYKENPYISLHNISPDDPIRLQYYKYDDLALKEQPLKTPDNFITKGSSKEIDITEQKLNWKWDLYNSDWSVSNGGDFVFPNHILAVDYKESKLHLNNTSDYSIIPQLSLTNNAGIKQGFYEDILVNTNILEQNYINLEVPTQTNDTGFCVYNTHINKDFTFEVQIPEDGYYVFNMNGYTQTTSGSIYKLIIKDKNEEIEIELKPDLPTAFFYLKKGNYTLSLNPMVQTSIYISSVGLYQIDLTDISVNTVLLASLLQDKIYTKAINHLKDPEYYKYIIFQAVYVYQESKVKCYKKTCSTLYTPEHAYQKPVGVYNGKSQNADLVSVDSQLKLLGYVESFNTNCNTLVENTIIKK